MGFDSKQGPYVALRAITSERTTPLTVWCGAGLSVPAGMPTWAKLRASLLDAVVSKASTLELRERPRLLAEARSANSERSSWIAFQRFRELLGVTSYRDTIREAFRPASCAPVPRAYQRLWRLRPRGVVNFNLDRLATRAHREEPDQPLAQEFNSRTVAAHVYVLKSLHPYIYNIHGTEDDFQSWVFTHEELRELQSDSGYRTFLQGVLTSSTAIFVGLTADDVGVESHLERLRESGVDFGTHYWLTDRRDRITDQWAERNSVRVIRYQNVDGTHSELDEMLEDLARYVPEEHNDAPPVASASVPPVRDLPRPEALAREDVERIRELLNGHAADILSPNTEESFAAYERFSDAYDIPIHLAWYTSTSPGRNLLLGYELRREEAKGSFGVVYQARDAHGNTVAVKVLRNDIRRSPELIQGFRRGVRSMRILESHEISGIARYRDAAEIPAFVVMDWIEGMNLSDAAAARLLSTWPDMLFVGANLARIIRSAHALPERVLHRDLRPANIMLRNAWSAETREVVVLDFDLSWHQGAYEQSLLALPGGTGYHAPEQLVSSAERSRRGVSTRHAAVDSFGLGMILFFMLTGTSPLPGQQRHQDWLETVFEAAWRRPCKAWRSAPHRYARLILESTLDEQSRRLDLAQIHAELARLREAVTDPRTVGASDLITEEVAARSDSLGEYTWQPNALAAVVRKATGLEIELAAHETDRRIRFSLGRPKMHSDAWRQYGPRIASALNLVAQGLVRAGWTDLESTGDVQDLQLCAWMPVERAAERLDAVADGLDKALAPLRFEPATGGQKSPRF